MTLLKVRVVECARGNPEHVGLTGIIESLNVHAGYPTYVRLDANQPGDQAICDANTFEPIEVKP